MGIDLSTVNLDGVQASAPLDAIPAGWYNAQMVGSEMKPCAPTAKDPTGQYMELTYQILDGEHAGRKLFDRLNLVNVNPTATKIGFETLKAIYNALGVARVNNSDEMHGKPLKVKVKVKGATAEYSASNEIAGYDSINSAHAPAGVTAGGVAGAPQGSPPWAGNAAPADAAPATGGAPAPAFAQAAQPWQQPGAQAPAGGAPAFAPPAQAAAPVDPMAGARADGWQAHPQHPGYSWRGQDVVADAELQKHYAAPAPAAASSGPPAFAPAQGATAGAAAGQTPPWQAGAAAAAPAQGAPAVGGPAPATAAAAGPTPPWARAG